MAEFNLIDKPWIPCIDLQGGQVELGIHDTLSKAHELREICDDSPLVTVAVHRLLLAILYRVFSGPTKFGEWKKLYLINKFDQGAIQVYLDKWRERFDLLSSSRPFYQMAGLETKTTISVSRLATEDASGHNATLFDHSGDAIQVDWTLAKTTRQLLACQSFALGFGKSGDAKINGIEETLPYSADAIALRGMNIWLQGENLFHTLLSNLVPIEDSSLPPWEMQDSNQYRDKLQDKKRRTIAAFGVVDRLTWQSRLIHFVSHGKSVSKMYFTQGRSADKSSGDPMKVYRSSKKEGVAPLPLNSARSAWRDAHSIFTLQAPNSNERRPECFNLVARAQSVAIMDTLKPFVVQIVGLASEPNKAGKFLLWRHEQMPVSVGLLGHADLIGRLGELIQNAEHRASELKSKTWQIARFFRVPSGQKPNKLEKEDIEKLAGKLNPCPAYWAQLEKHFYPLLENLPNDWDEATDDWKPEEQQRATNTWLSQVKHEAEQTLRESIRSLGTTARAIQAVARVRTNFNDSDLKKTTTRKRKGGKSRS